MKFLQTATSHLAVRITAINCDTAAKRFHDARGKIERLESEHELERQVLLLCMAFSVGAGHAIKKARY